MKILFTIILFFSTLFAQTTLCYKNDTFEPELNKEVILDGGECLSSYSTKDMIRDGWKLDDYKVINKEDKYNHIFIFSKKDATNVRVLPQTYYKKTYTKIEDTFNNTARINLPYLKVGQSGAVVKTVDENYLIVSAATVTQSDKEGSTIEFSFIDLLNNNYLPNSNLKPANGDTFVLNHLYNTSLMIVPNTKAKKLLLDNYKRQNFLSEDFFASYLKLNNTPIPNKQEIKEFCKQQQIGTIYIVVKNNLYIVDALSFTILDTIEVAVNDSKTQMPFLTKIEEIESSMFDIDLSLETVTGWVKKLNLYDPDYNPNATTTNTNKDKVIIADPNAKFQDYNTHYLNMLGQL